MRVRRNLPRIFKVPPALVDATETVALFTETKTHSPCERIPGPRWFMQKRQLFQSSGGRLLVVSRCHDGYEGPKRFRDQVLEYEPDPLSAEMERYNIIIKNTPRLNKASPKP